MGTANKGNIGGTNDAIRGFDWHMNSIANGMKVNYPKLLKPDSVMTKT